MPKENRRVKITKLLLTDSFLRLLAEKPLSHITVKAICEDADLNRSTYYQYYADPYDQMAKLKASIITEMTSYTELPQEERISQETALYTVIKKTLDYMDSKKEMFRILLCTNGDISLQKDIQSIFAEKLVPLYFNPSTNKTALQEFIFISSGSFGIIYYWLSIDTQISTGELTAQITHFVKKFMS